MSEEIIEQGYDGELKIILLGEVFTGKTSLINAYTKEKFNPEINTTTSPSYFSKLITVGNQTILVNIWDTAGQEKFRSMNKIFIKKSNIVLFIYDITRKKTFKELSFWVKYVENCIGKDNIIFCVVGNKLDLFDKEEELKQKNFEFDLVDTEEAREFANNIGAEYLETSAKESGASFVKFLDKIIGQYVEKYMNFVKNNKGKKGIQLDDDKDLSKQKKNKCC